MNIKNAKKLKTLLNQADNAKKVNPLDLSSDQDLTVALMNLLAIENDFYTDGATDGVGAMVHNIRMRLMGRIVENQHMDMSARLLARAMQMIDDGGRAMASGNQTDAYALFDDAYGLYSLFWGLNMGLITTEDVLQSDVEF